MSIHFGATTPPIPERSSARTAPAVPNRNPARTAPPIPERNPLREVTNRRTSESSFATAWTSQPPEYQPESQAGRITPEIRRSFESILDKDSFTEERSTKLNNLIAESKPTKRTNLTALAEAWRNRVRR